MIENRIAYNNFIDYRFTVEAATGPYIQDTQGNQYVDLTSGWNVVNLGWNDSEVSAAIVDQARRHVYTPMAMSDPARDRYAAELTLSLIHI